MVLARDLMLGPVLLIPQGRALDEVLIAALRQLERRQDLRLQVEVERHGAG
jgi:hypothetical protein